MRNGGLGVRSPKLCMIATKISANADVLPGIQRFFTHATSPTKQQDGENQYEHGTRATDILWTSGLAVNAKSATQCGAVI